MNTPEAGHDTAPTPEEAVAAKTQIASLLDDHESFGSLTEKDLYTKKVREDGSIEEEAFEVRSGGNFLSITRRQTWDDSLLVPAYAETVTATGDMLGQSRAMLMVEETLAPEGHPRRTKIHAAEYRDSLNPENSHVDGKITRDGLKMATMTIDMVASALKEARAVSRPANQPEQPAE